MQIDILFGIGVIFLLGLLCCMASLLKDIRSKLWQLHEITNEIHSLLRDKLK